MVHYPNYHSDVSPVGASSKLGLCINLGSRTLQFVTIYSGLNENENLLI